MPCDPRCTPGCSGRWLVFRRCRGVVGDFLDGGFYGRFSRNGERSPTRSGWRFLVLALFGGFSTIEAEAFGTPPLLFGFCQLSICIEDITKLLFWQVGILGRWLGHSCRLCLWGCRGCRSCCHTNSCTRSQDWKFFVLPLPVSVVALEGVDLELFKGSGSFQIEELVFDPFSKTTIKFTVKGNIVPSSIRGVLGELN